MCSFYQLFDLHSIGGSLQLLKISLALDLLLMHTELLISMSDSDSKIETIHLCVEFTVAQGNFLSPMNCDSFCTLLGIPVSWKVTTA